MVVEALLTAAHAEAGGDTSAAAACAAELAGGYFAREERLLSTGAGLALAQVITRLWRAGWLPGDVWEIARRRTDAAASSLLIDTVAADFARHAPATVHERWAAQVGQLGAALWWDREQPHLGQWVARSGLSFHDGLFTAITLLAVLVALPELPQLVPPPGTATRRAASPAAGVDQRILGRVRGLLAKAESTEYPEEAEALSAKAQELMNRHAFERALVDAEHHKQQSATSTRLWLDSPYLEAKSHLVAAIADANRCKSVFYPK
ncbi:MAG: DUF2786 domain-containing protein, partial [Thermocrispum sp.]